MTAIIRDLSHVTLPAMGTPMIAREDVRKSLLSKMCRAADFPKPGVEYLNVLFTMTRYPGLFADVVSCLAEEARSRTVTAVVGIESRGFVFAAPVALALGVPFIPVRKKGKLPPPVHSVTYALEYGTDSLEIAQDAAPQGSRVILVDDILATGGTAKAAADLLERVGHEVVAIAFVGEISQLHGRSKLGGHEVISLAEFRPQREV